MKKYLIFLLALPSCTLPPRRINDAPGAPKAIGPYAQAVEVRGMVYLSGQIPLDPVTGKLVEGDIKAQTTRVLENLKAVLEAAGLSMRSVVKATVYMTDLGEFAAMNEVYATYFPTDPPARATVQVAALPRGAKIEIEFVAAR